MIYPKNPYCPFDKDYMKPDGGNNGNNIFPGGDDCMCPGNGNGNNGNGTGNNGNGTGNNGNGNNGNNGGNGSNGSGNMNCAQMYTKISELEFAITDLNLYLDTHPNNKEALELFTKLSATLHSLKSDYGKMCAPICATDVKNEVPFRWVSSEYKWPWEA